jgi:hypothetical protein
MQAQAQERDGDMDGVLISCGQKYMSDLIEDTTLKLRKLTIS